MKKCNLEKLPDNWGIWLDSAKKHPRLQEFKEIYTHEMGSKSGISFNAPYCGLINGTRLLSAFADSYDQIITIDQFFTLIEEPKIEVGDSLVCKIDFTIGKDNLIKKGDSQLVGKTEKDGVCIKDKSRFFTYDFIAEYFTIEKGLDLTVGNWLYCFKSWRGYKKDEGRIFQILSCNSIVVFENEEATDDVEVEDVRHYFRKATKEEIESVVSKTENTEWVPESGQKVLVRNPHAYDDDWHERTFAFTHNSLYFCQTEDKRQLFGWDEIKPYNSGLFTDKHKAMIEEIERECNVKLTATKIQ